MGKLSGTSESIDWDSSNNNKDEDGDDDNNNSNNSMRDSNSNIDDIDIGNPSGGYVENKRKKLLPNNSSRDFLSRKAITKERKKNITENNNNNNNNNNTNTNININTNTNTNTNNNNNNNDSTIKKPNPKILPRSYTGLDDDVIEVKIDN